MSHRMRYFFFRLKKPRRFQIFYYKGARFRARKRAVFFRTVFVERAVGIQNIYDFKIVALPDLPVVRVVGGRDFYHSRAEFFIDVGIRDERNNAVSERKAELFSDNRFVAFVFRIDGNRRVAEQGFRARRCNFYARRAVGRGTVCKLVPNMIHRAVGVRVINFIVGKRRAAARTPVDQIMSLIDEFALVQRNEDFSHGFGKSLVQRKAFSVPVCRIPELSLLFDNRLVMVVFDRPCPLKEFFTSQVIPALAFFFERALDDVLRRNARVVGSRYPQRVVAFHAVIAHDNVLQRVVQSVSDVENTRNVRRRDNDGIQRFFAVGGIFIRFVQRKGGIRRGLKASAFFPFIINTFFKIFRIVGFFKFNSVHAPDYSELQWLVKAFTVILNFHLWAMEKCLSKLRHNFVYKLSI